MKLQGLQKLTLLDYPGHVACTVFLGGCNFRCPFCHNAPLVVGGEATDEIDSEALLAFLKKRVGILDGVAVTGGEPTLREELPALLRSIKALGFSVKLDTNGSAPERLRHLVSEGLCDYVAMDIKNAMDAYAKTVGIPNLDLSPIEESIDFLLSDAIPYEFRTTVTRDFHTKELLVDAARRIAGCKRYYLQGFVDSGALIAPGITGYSKEEMEAFASAIRPIIPGVALRGV